MTKDEIDAKIANIIHQAKKQVNEQFDPNSEKITQGHQIGVNDAEFIERAKRLQNEEEFKFQQSVKGYESRLREYAQEISLKPGRERLNILLYNVNAQIAFLLRNRNKTQYHNVKFDVLGFQDPNIFRAYKRRECDELIESFKGLIGQISAALSLVKEDSFDKIKESEHNLFNNMPLEDVKSFFRAELCVKNSLGVQILNNEDFEKFINAAFLGKPLNTKLKLNISAKGNAAIGSVFHKFYVKNKQSEETEHCAPKYRKLVTDHFSNWTDKRFLSFFRS